MRITSLSPSHRASAVLPLVVQAALVLLGVVLLFVPPADLPDTSVLSAALTFLLVWSLVSWRLAGLRLFDPLADPPALFSPGDRVRFTREE